MEIRAWMRQEGGRWIGGIEGDPSTQVRASTHQRCLRALERAIRTGGNEAEPTTLVVEVLPVLAGVAEAAVVMGWDKRRVITYIDRGRFPEPVQSLASGRVWKREDIERFASDWRARQATRSRRKPSP